MVSTTGALQPRALRNQAVHGLIRPLHQAVGTYGDNRVLHAVEQGFELALAGTHGGKTVLDLAGGLIDGGGDPADFVLRRHRATRAGDRLRRCGRQHRQCVPGGASVQMDATAAISKAIEQRKEKIPEARQPRRTCAELLRHRKADRPDGRRLRRRARRHKEKECQAWRCGARSGRFGRQGRRRIPGAWHDFPCPADRPRNRQALCRRRR